MSSFEESLILMNPDLLWIGAKRDMDAYRQSYSSLEAYHIPEDIS